MRNTLFVLFLSISTFCFSQKQKIKILNSEQTYKNVQKYPGAVVLNGKVKVSHDGIMLNCNKALYFELTNIIHAYGDVVINQGDTLIQTSSYSNYNGNSKKAISWGEVVITDPSMTLKTDTLHFDRNLQELFYSCSAVMNDKQNELTSQTGRYYLAEKKFTAREHVIVKNPKNRLDSEYLDYFTETGVAMFFGPSKITTKESVAYADKGSYDTKKGLSKLKDRAKIYYDNRIIEGDSIYNNRVKGFSSATGNVIITDTINKTIVKGGYAEYFKLKDSILITKRPYAVTIMDKDSLFIHGDRMLITGKPEQRIIRAYKHVKFFKSDMSGKCDSLHTNQKTGLTKLFKNPIIWSGINQITGDSIQLLSDTKTSKLDSLFIKQNAFIIQKDSVGFNQIKGIDMYGKFEENHLKTLLAKGNGEVVNYARDEEKILIAIMKMNCSNILFELNENAINNIKFLKMPDGKTYPPSQFPADSGKLKGFIWRESEQPLKMEDIFIHDDEVVSPTTKEESLKTKEQSLKTKDESQKSKVEEPKAKS